MQTRILKALAPLLLVASTANGQPMSAIDWLTDSVSVPEAPVAPDDIATDATSEPISVRTLDGPSMDGVGLSSPQSLGLPDDLWERSDPQVLADLIARTQVHPDAPALRDLLIELLSLAAKPPVTNDIDGNSLLVRVDRLLEMGALDRAAGLLEQTDLSDPRIFKRWFDVRLLMGTEDVACDRLIASPDLSPTFPTTIFCLARAGDWDAAAISLDTAEALGLVTPAEDALLLRFLDGTNSEDHGPLTLPAQITPLVFRLYEAVGEPISTEVLPRAFAHTDLSPQNGWKARLAAGERLAAAGALPAKDLMALYLERRPAASGSVWDRARRVQDVNSALNAKDLAALDRAIPNLWAAMAPINLGKPTSVFFGPKLDGLDLQGSTKALSDRLVLLSGVGEISGPPQESNRFAYALHSGTQLPDSADPMQAQISAAFAQTSLPPIFRDLVEERRHGEAALRAIDLFSAGADGNLDDLGLAIAVLRAIGLERVARQAALEVLILGGNG